MHVTESALKKLNLKNLGCKQKIQCMYRRTLRSGKILAGESPLRMMKNAFYFTSKALFVLKMFKFLF